MIDITLIIAFCSGIILPGILWYLDRGKHRELLKTQFEMIKILRQQNSLLRNQSPASSKVEEQTERLQIQESSLKRDILKMVRGLGRLSRLYEEYQKDAQNDAS